MRTEFHSTWTLRADTPPSVVSALRWLLIDRQGNFGDGCPFKDDHPFWALSCQYEIGEHYNAPFHWDGTEWLWWSSFGLVRCREITVLDNGQIQVVASASLTNYQTQIESFCSWVSQFDANPEVHEVGSIAVEPTYKRGILMSDGTTVFKENT